MPFKSKAQEKWLWANKPGLAQEWQAATPKGKKLPVHVKSPKKTTGGKKSR